MRNENYLAFIRKQPCAACNEHDAEKIQAHHESLMKWKPMAAKVSDYWTLPLCYDCHHRLGVTGKKTFWTFADTKMLVIQHLTRYIELLRDRRA